MKLKFFETIATGASAEDAYRKAVNKAMMDHGLRNFTGTILEASWFIETDETPDPTHPWIQHSGAPCFCNRLHKGRYLFWGLATPREL